MFVSFVVEFVNQQKLMHPKLPFYKKILEKILKEKFQVTDKLFMMDCHVVLEEILFKSRGLWTKSVNKRIQKVRVALKKGT